MVNIFAASEFFPFSGIHRTERWISIELPLPIESAKLAFVFLIYQISTLLISLR